MPEFKLDLRRFLEYISVFNCFGVLPIFPSDAEVLIFNAIFSYKMCNAKTILLTSASMPYESIYSNEIKMLSEKKIYTFEWQIFFVFLQKLIKCNRRTIQIKIPTTVRYFLISHNFNGNVQCNSIWYSIRISIRIYCSKPICFRTCKTMVFRYLLKYV